MTIENAARHGHVIRRHGATKYVSGQILETSFDKNWHAMLAEHRSHCRGRLPDIVPAETEIAVLLEGKVRVSLRGDGHVQDTVGIPGTIWLCPAGQLEKDVTIYNDVDNILHLYVPERPISMAATADLKVEPGNILIRYEGGFQDPLIEQLARSVLREMHDATPASALLIDTISATLCAHLLRHYSNLTPRQSRSPAAEGALGNVWRRRIVDYIESNLDNKITLDDLAREACLSTFHFARFFKARMGISPHQYVTHRKLDRAKELLVETKLSIMKIGLETGFTSQAHFSRLFKSRFGFTPGKYRARAR